MEDFLELKTFLEEGSLLKAAKKLNISTTKINKDAYNQAYKLLRYFKYIPDHNVNDLYTAEEERYSDKVSDIKRNKAFFLELLNNFVSSQQKIERIVITDDRLLSSLTVAEFKKLMQDILANKL